ncbi:MAG: helix-turn-helix domain-containing protein [Desulfomonile sp.]|nr:helix-turn-helix domain-containing protein [Desulfomonile sp.]
MKSDVKPGAGVMPSEGTPTSGHAEARLRDNISGSLDSLVEYLMDNGVKGIHPLVMGEIEKRLIIKVLERSRGNKLRAAELLGMSRNAFYKKVRKLSGMGLFAGADRES